MGKMDQPSSWPKRSTESKKIEHPFAALQSFPAELSSSGTKALTLGPGLVPRPSLWEADQKIDVWCYPLDYTGLRSWKQCGEITTHTNKLEQVLPKFHEFLQTDYSTKHGTLDDVGLTMPYRNIVYITQKM